MSSERYTTMPVDTPVSPDVEMSESRPQKIVISVDIEANGGAPTVASCLEIGLVVADQKTRKVIERKNWMIKPAKDKGEDPRTMSEFWAKPGNKEHLEEIVKDGLEPEAAIKELSDWWEATLATYGNSNIKWVARPSSYDWQWVNGYYEQFKPQGRPSLPHSVPCLTTLSDGIVMTGHVTKDELYAIFKTIKVSMAHKAVVDAEHQLHRLFILEDLFAIVNLKNTVITKTIDTNAKVFGVLAKPYFYTPVE